MSFNNFRVLALWHFKWLIWSKPTLGEKPNLGSGWRQKKPSSKDSEIETQSLFVLTEGIFPSPLPCVDDLGFVRIASQIPRGWCQLTQTWAPPGKRTWTVILRSVSPPILCFSSPTFISTMPLQTTPHRKKFFQEKPNFLKNKKNLYFSKIKSRDLHNSISAL